MSRVIDRDPTVGAGSAAAITPDDNTDLNRTTRGVYVGGAGDLAVIFDRDTASVTLTGVLAGSVLPIRVRRVLSTGTTATALIALY